MNIPGDLKTQSGTGKEIYFSIKTTKFLFASWFSDICSFANRLKMSLMNLKESTKNLRIPIKLPLKKSTEILLKPIKHFLTNFKNSTKNLRMPIRLPLMKSRRILLTTIKQFLTNFKNLTKNLRMPIRLPLIKSRKFLLKPIKQFLTNLKNLTKNLQTWTQLPLTDLNWSRKILRRWMKVFVRF